MVKGTIFPLSAFGEFNLMLDGIASRVVLAIE